MKIPKISWSIRDVVEDETSAFVTIVFTNLMDLKRLVMDAYRTKNNLPKEQREILSKLTEERKMVICRPDKGGEIAILNYEDYNVIMIKETQ